MNGRKERVLLGMSGGVDSSVAGYLLREQGYDVVGVTMKVWPQDCISRAEDKCCGPQAIADARGVAHSLGIPHYVVDEADQFERVVIDLPRSWETWTDQVLLGSSRVFVVTDMTVNPAAKASGS